MTSQLDLKKALNYFKIKFADPEKFSTFATRYGGNDKKGEG